MVGIESGYTPQEVTRQSLKQVEPIKDTETKKPISGEVWVVDDNSHGYSAMCKHFQKTNPDATFTIFGTYERAEETIAEQIKNGQKLPDVIYAGTDRNTFADQSRKERLQYKPKAPSGSERLDTLVKNQIAQLGEEYTGNSEELATQMEETGLVHPPTIVDMKGENIVLSGDLYKNIESSLRWREAEANFPGNEGPKQTI